MAKFVDFYASREVADIMDDILERFPRVFPGFDLNKIGIIHTNDKKAKGNPLKLRAVRYPHSVWLNQTYILEVADLGWKDMGEKKRRLSVFHVMCAIPDGGFDEQSDNYAKIRKPDYSMFAEEFAVTGGVPNWLDNDDARDPIDASDDEVQRAVPAEKTTPKKKVKRVPVTLSSLGGDTEDSKGESES